MIRNCQGDNGGMIEKRDFPFTQSLYDLFSGQQNNFHGFKIAGSRFLNPPGAGGHEEMTLPAA